MTAPTRLTVACVVRQVGSAHALLPVMRALRGRGVDVTALAFEPACGATRGHDRFERIASADDGIRRLGQESGLGFLLCGTSERAEEDAALWLWARQRGIPHLALLDSWVNYWQRFTSAGGRQRFDLVPDAVAVPDEAAARRMEAEGCPAGVLVVTGNPAFDAWATLDLAPGHVWRRRMLRPGESILAVFVLEPLAAFYGADPSSERYLGYTEEDALAWAVRALDAIAAARSTWACLAVLPHPRQRLTDVEAMIGRRGGPAVGHVRLETGEHDRREAVGGADVVMGMTSTLLYEATLAGRPVVSFQPRRRAGSDLTDLHTVIRVVTEENAAMPAVEEALRTVPVRARAAGGATGRLASYVLRALR